MEVMVTVMTDDDLECEHDPGAWPGNNLFGWRITVLHNTPRDAGNKMRRYDVLTIDDAPPRHRTALAVLLAAHSGPNEGFTNMPDIGFVSESTQWGPSVRLNSEVWEHGLYTETKHSP